MRGLPRENKKWGAAANRAGKTNMLAECLEPEAKEVHSSINKRNFMTDTTSRLDELEMRAAHQEQTIEDLNTAITEQWKIIERMERQLAALRDRVADAELSAGEAAHVDRPPPHW